ncbi:MAG: hypothetical protein ACFCU2_06930 [Acidimicrobiia bacterium]
MTTETLADQILRVRQRLAEIEAERADLATDDFRRKTDLIDEERTLEARLAGLRDSAAQELSEATPGSVGGPSRATSADEDLGAEEGQNGKASGYERVPDDDQGLNDTDGDQR